MNKALLSSKIKSSGLKIGDWIGGKNGLSTASVDAIVRHLIMSDWYILDENKKPVKCNDHIQRHKWIQSLPEDQRTGIGCIVDKWHGDGVSVSTVFLGLDHGWQSEVPVVFETMIFGGERDEDCERYTTWEDAKAGHAKIVEEVKAQYA